MSQRSAASIGASLLVATLALTACGSRGGDTTSSTSGSTGSGSAAAGTKTAKIGVIAPLSGDLAALGLGIQNSVDLAIKQANESGAIPGWTLEIAAEDDQATADVGKNAATKLAGEVGEDGRDGVGEGGHRASASAVTRARARAVSSSGSNAPSRTR